MRSTWRGRKEGTKREEGGEVGVVFGVAILRDWFLKTILLLLLKGDEKT